MELYEWVFQMSDDRYIPGEKLSFSSLKNNFYYALQEVLNIIDDIIRETDMKSLTPNIICNLNDYWIELRKKSKMRTRAWLQIAKCNFQTRSCVITLFQRHIR